MRTNCAIAAISPADQEEPIAGPVAGNRVAVSPWVRRMAAGEPFAWPALRWIMDRETRVVRLRLGRHHMSQR